MYNLTNIEICCGDPMSLREAVAGGARRVELCAGLSDGGVTPAESLTGMAAMANITEINVLVRPRSGDFLYNELEWLAIRNDALNALNAGANGIVVGALDPDGNVDTEMLGSLIDFIHTEAESRGVDLNLTFHRAVDVCRDWRHAFDEIIALGFDCVLTSGQAPDAEAGIPTLREMVDYARGRIKIMAGSGVTPANAMAIAASGVDLLHSTARLPVPSMMKWRRGGVSMGAPATDEYSVMRTSSAIVNQFINLINLEN